MSRLVHQSNVLDREALELDPASVTPLPGKCIVRRTPKAEMAGRFYIPESSKHRRAPMFEGEVVAIGPAPGEEAEAVDLAVGDYVWFAYNVGPDDSAFFTWAGVGYALVPVEAIQAVRR